LSIESLDKLICRFRKAEATPTNCPKNLNFRVAPHDEKKSDRHSDFVVSTAVKKRDCAIAISVIHKIAADGVRRRLLNAKL
jgi:hypothetical protein